MKAQEVPSDQNTIVDAFPPANDPQPKGSTEKSSSSPDLSEPNADESDGTPKVGQEHGWEGVPDGGLRAWLVVLASSCGTFSTFGYVNAWGVFQAYYAENLLSDTSQSTIAWIGSIEYALIFIPGLLTGRLFDQGHLHLPLIISSAVLVVATFLTAECTKYWHFLLCQGLLSGMACGMIFGPMIGIISHWFRLKRGVALGWVALGSSIGGTTFPIAARNLIPIVGFPWTMRILGFIQLFALAITNICIKRRLPAKSPEERPKLSLSIFKYAPYTMYTISMFVAFLGLYTVLTYIDQSAVTAGVDPDFSFYLVAIANACSGLGRVGGGFVADKLGAMNVLIPSTLISGVLTYAWPFATTEGGLIAIAIIYGIASGVYVSLLAAPVMGMGSPHDVGIRIGCGWTILAIGALAGPPISGAIFTATGGFKAVGYYAGSTVILSVVLMVIARHWSLGQFRGKI